MTLQSDSASIELRIITPGRAVFQGHVHWVQIPLTDGLLGVWPGHAPLVGALGRGILQFGLAAETRSIEIDGGILRIDETGCTVLLGAGSSGLASSDVDREALSRGLEEMLTETLSEQQIADLQKGPLA